jgi:hypothetical protein
MGYTEDSQMVRVDFFKPSGKWYCTEAIKWDRYRSTVIAESPLVIAKDYEHIQDTFARCLREQLKGRLRGMTAICLKPYHEFAFPLSCKDWEVT